MNFTTIKKLLLKITWIWPSVLHWSVHEVDSMPTVSSVACSQLNKVRHWYAYILQVSIRPSHSQTAVSSRCVCLRKQFLNACGKLLLETIWLKTTISLFFWCAFNYRYESAFGQFSYKALPCRTADWFKTAKNTVSTQFFDHTHTYNPLITRICVSTRILLLTIFFIYACLRSRCNE